MNSPPYFLQTTPVLSRVSPMVCWQGFLLVILMIIALRMLFSNSRGNSSEREIIREILRQQREGFAPTLTSVPVSNSKDIVESIPSSTVLPFTPANSDEIVQLDPKIVPPVYDPTSKSVMSGVGIQRPQLESPWGGIYNKSKLQSKYYLDDGAKGTAGLNFNLCSKSCCSQQWPTPFKLKYDPLTCSQKKNLTPTNYMCNNAWQDSGCVCLRKNQATHLMDRGGNA
jgi:hypothetical protein